MTNSLYLGGFEVYTVKESFTPNYGGGPSLRHTDGRHTVGTMLPAKIVGFSADIAPFDDAYYTQMEAMLAQQAIFPAVLPTGERVAVRKNAVTRTGYVGNEAGEISVTFDVNRRTIFADMGASMAASEMGRFCYPLGVDPSLSYIPKAWEWNEAPTLVPGSAWALRQPAAGADIAPFNNARPVNTWITRGSSYPQRMAVIDITPGTIDNSSGTAWSIYVGMTDPSSNLLTRSGFNSFGGGFGFVCTRDSIAISTDTVFDPNLVLTNQWGHRLRFILWAIPGGKARGDVWYGNTLIHRGTGLYIPAIATGYVPFITVPRGIANIHCIWIDEV
jgi:hypothetical protein